jgi:hypothetical protein
MLMNTQTKRLSLLVLTATLASIVLFLSYPRFTSSLSYIPVDAALKRHWEDYPIKQSQFPVLIGIAEKAIQKLDLARYWQGLGWLYYLQANALNVETEEGKKILGQSQNAFEAALKKSPANPASWLRLAWIHGLLNHDSSVIVNTLNMSFYTGRAERYLILNRLDLALQYADYFEAEDLPMVRDQIQLAWRFFPADMLKFIQSGTFDKYTLLVLITNTHPELATEIQDKL